MYKNVYLFFFTGTGNSYRVGRWVAEVAEQQGLEAEVAPVEAGTPAHGVGPETLLGLFAPVHGFTAPWKMIRFALQLPPGNGAGAFAMICRGAVKFGNFILPGLEGSAAYLLLLILWLKGYRPRGARGIDMPGSWTTVMPGQSPAAVETLREGARKTILEFIHPVLAGRTAFRSLIPLALGILLLPVSFLYLIMGRFFLAKLFYASTRCDGCGVCARACPVNAIRMKRRRGPARPFWTLRCESCTRCMNFCPRQAVEASYPFAALVLWLGNLPLLNLALDRLWKALHITGMAAGALDELVLWGYKLLVMVVFYFGFDALVRTRWVNRLLTRLTPTAYYARYREPETRLADLKK